MAALQFHSPPDLHCNWRPRTRVGLTFSPRMSKAMVTLLSSCTNSNNGSASSSNGNTGRERISPNNSGFEGLGAPAGGERRKRFTTATGGNNNGFEGRTMGHSGSIDSSAAANKQPEDTDSLWQSVFPAYMRSKEEDYEEEEEEEEYQYHRGGEEEEKKKKKEKEMGNPIPDETRGLKRAAAAKAAAAAAKELESHVASSLISSSATTGAPSTPPCLSASALNGGRNLQELITDDPIWAAIRAEARLEAEREPLLSSFLYASILAHPCFERSLGFVLANRLKNATLLATQLMDVFDDVLISHPSIQLAIRLDVQAVKDRDPSCTSYSCALLYLKGYHALQSYRVAHALWKRGQKVLALALQSRISEVFAVDIHPAARIGKAILLDHGTGVVIGETAVVGDRVSMLQGVTLGGTGKEAGDRHPKIGEGVLIGAGATILGNITVGRGAMVAAGSLVLKDVPNHSMVAGTPARVVGVLKEPTPALTMKHDATKDFCESVADGFLFGGAGI